MGGGVVFSGCNITGFVFLQSPLKIWMRSSGIPWLQWDQSKNWDQSQNCARMVRQYQTISYHTIQCRTIPYHTMSLTDRNYRDVHATEFWAKSSEAAAYKRHHEAEFENPGQFWKFKVHATIIENGTKTCYLWQLQTKRMPCVLAYLLRFRTGTRECWWLYCVQ